MRLASIIPLVLLPAVVLCASALGSTGPLMDNGPSRSIFDPPRRANLHAHEKCPEAKKNCLSCHPKARASEWSSDRLIPAMKDCAVCHPVTQSATVLTPVTEDCRNCHQSITQENLPVRSNYRRPNLRFSHKAHVKMRCADCHPKSAAALPLSEDLDVTGMRQCLRCHSNSPCRTCHLTDKDGRMITDFGRGKLTPPAWLRGKSHGIEWTGTHPIQAGSDSEFCAACHTEAFCRDCHSGARRPRKVHTGDWLTSHGVSTRMDNPRCTGCHRAQSFCITCHRRVGAAGDSPPNAKPKDAGRYHKGMETRSLMRRAKRDIVSCVSCHTESSCISCHIRYNPHPTDFAHKCKPLAARNRNACAKCHTDDVTRFCR